MADTPRPLSIRPGFVRGDCMAPVWNDHDPCLIAWYGLTWPELAALHGHLCVYIFQKSDTDKSLGSWGGILDHVEMEWPRQERALVFRTINPIPHETIRRMPLRLLRSIGRVYPVDERHLIPEPLDPVETFIVDIEVPRPLRKPASAARPRAFAGGKPN